MTEDAGDVARLQGLLDHQASVIEERYWTEQLLEEQGKTQRKFVVVQRRLTYLLFYWTALPLLLAWTFTTLLPKVAKELGVGQADWRMVTGVLFLSGLSTRLLVLDIFGSKDSERSADPDTSNPTD